MGIVGTLGFRISVQLANHKILVALSKSYVILINSFNI